MAEFGQDTPQFGLLHWLFEPQGEDGAAREVDSGVQSAWQNKQHRARQDDDRRGEEEK